MALSFGNDWQNLLGPGLKAAPLQSYSHPALCLVDVGEGMLVPKDFVDAFEYNCYPELSHYKVDNSAWSISENDKPPNALIKIYPGMIVHPDSYKIITIPP